MDTDAAASKTVLVIDDDADIRKLLEVNLSHGGFRVITAASGEEGISKLSYKPDAVILDLMMPGCGGMGVLRYVKNLNGALPTIMVLTAHYANHPDAAIVRDDPYVAKFLTKPVDHDWLIGALHSYLGDAPATPGSAGAAA